MPPVQTNPTHTGRGDRILESRFYPGSDGTVDAHVVLCDIGLRNSVHPFVVWWMRADDGSTFNGEYCETLREALDLFDKRTGMGDNVRFIPSPERRAQ